MVTKKKESLKLDGVKIEVLHWAPAHTTGDLVVYLPSEKIIFTGDIILAQMADPLVHLEKNGSSEGLVTTTKGILTLDADQYVPGHGPIQKKYDIENRPDARGGEARKNQGAGGGVQVIGRGQDGRGRSYSSPWQSRSLCQLHRSCLQGVFEEDLARSRSPAVFLLAVSESVQC